MVAAIAVFVVFGGFSGMEAWLRAHPGAVESLYRPVREGPWSTLILLSLAAGFLLPRQFHMAFTESLDERGMRAASCACPRSLLLLHLACPASLWAATGPQPKVKRAY